MKINDSRVAQKLRKGQLWKLKRGYVLIVAQVDSSIQFKFIDSPNEMKERTLTSGIDTLWGYLLSRQDRLVNALTQTTERTAAVRR